MALNKVEICGVNTAKLPILSNEEKTELFRRIKEGDPGCQRAVHQRQFKAGTQRDQTFLRSNENPDDLFQIGCIGLIKSH